MQGSRRSQLTHDVSLVPLLRNLERPGPSFDEVKVLLMVQQMYKYRERLVLGSRCAP